MPTKYGRRRHTPRSEGAAVTTAPTATQTMEAPAPVKVAAKKAPALPPNTYPYVKGELKVIGILTAVVAVIMVVLALILR